jgi:hypothetical protein
MSMIGNYMRVKPDQLTFLQKFPENVTNLLFPEEDSDFSSECHLDIDKTWHAIHFLLNGETWAGTPPLQNTVRGGIEISDEDVGYGPARFLNPKEVKQTAKALSEISEAELLSRFDPVELNAAGIYPETWGEIEKEQEYIGQHYRALVNFFQEASEAGDAMLLYLD